MPFVFHIAKSLTLKSEISAVEAVTLLTSASIAASTLYNFGFFAPTEVSLVSVLSVQDLLVGAAFAALPLVSAGYAFRAAYNLLTRIEHATRYVWVVVLVDVAAIGGTVWSALFMDERYVSAFFTALYIAIGVAAALLNRRFHWRYFNITALFISVIYWIFFTGFSNYYTSIADYKKSLSEIDMKNGAESVIAKIIRTTSAYFFVYDGSRVIAIPSANVELVKLPVPNSQLLGVIHG